MGELYNPLDQYLDDGTLAGGPPAAPVPGEAQAAAPGTAFAGLHNPLDQFDDAAPATASQENALWAEVKKSGERGVQSFKSLGYGLSAMLGEAMDVPGLQDWGMEGYLTVKEEMEANPATIGTFRNINDFGDAGIYLVEAVMENLPMFLPSLVTGGLGAMVARKAAEKAISGYLSKQMLKGLSADAAMKATQRMVKKRIVIGSMAGALPATTALNTGENWGEIYEETGETGAMVPSVSGLASGTLDLLPVVALFKRVLGPKVTGEVVKGFWRRLGKAGMEQFFTEMPTETAQTIITKAAVKFVDPTKDIFTKKNIDEFIDAGLKGGFAGAGIGMGGEVLSTATGARKTIPPPQQGAPAPQEGPVLGPNGRPVDPNTGIEYPPEATPPGGPPGGTGVQPPVPPGVLPTDQIPPTPIHGALEGQGTGTGMPTPVTGAPAWLPPTPPTLPPEPPPAGPVPGMPLPGETPPTSIPPTDIPGTLGPGQQPGPTPVTPTPPPAAPEKPTPPPKEPPPPPKEPEPKAPPPKEPEPPETPKAPPPPKEPEPPEEEPPAPPPPPPPPPPKEPEPVKEPPKEPPKEEPKEPEPPEPPAPPAPPETPEPVKEPPDDIPPDEPAPGEDEGKAAPIDGVDDEDIDNIIDEVLGEKEPHQMLRHEVRSLPAKEIRERFIKPAADRVRAKAGTSDLQGIYNFYEKKYGLPHVRISVEKRPIQYDSRGLGITGGWYMPSQKKIAISSFAKLDEQIVTLRHEIEHVVDIEKGWTPVRGDQSSYEWQDNNTPVTSSPEWYEEMWGDKKVRVYPGHHQFFDIFNVDYAYRQAIKAAQEAGKEIPEDVLEQYPDLKGTPATPEPVEDEPTEEHKAATAKLLAHGIEVQKETKIFGNLKSEYKAIVVDKDKSSFNTRLKAFREAKKTIRAVWDKGSVAWRFVDDPTIEIAKELPEPVEAGGPGEGPVATPSGEDQGGQTGGPGVPTSPEVETGEDTGGGGPEAGGGTGTPGLPGGPAGPGTPGGPTEPPDTGVGPAGEPGGGQPPSGPTGEPGGPSPTPTAGGEGGPQGGEAGGGGGGPGPVGGGTGPGPSPVKHPGWVAPDDEGLLSTEEASEGPATTKPDLNIPPGEPGHVEAEQAYKIAGRKHILNSYRSWFQINPEATAEDARNFIRELIMAVKEGGSPPWKVRRYGNMVKLFRAEVLADPSILMEGQQQLDVDPDEVDDAAALQQQMTEEAKDLDEQVEAHHTQAAYVSVSSQDAGGAVAPAEITAAIRRALSELVAELSTQKKYEGMKPGDVIDNFVADELGWSYDHLYKGGPEGSSRLLGTQVDAIAMAIQNHKKGNAFILGDQTGLGKGRTVAAMLRYAWVNDIVPTFMTAQPGLYGDMYRDIYDIGWDDFQGLPTNNFKDASQLEQPADEDGDERVTAGGVMLPPRPGTEQTGLGDEMLGQPDFVFADNRIMSYDDWYAHAIAYPEDFALPEIVEPIPGVSATARNRWRSTGKKYSALFTTYGQLQPTKNHDPDAPPGATTNARRALFQRNIGRLYMAMDESHKAGGDMKSLQAPDPDSGKIPSTALFLRSIVSKSNGTLFSSATFSKNPVTMTLYASTSLRHAVEDPSDLYEMMERGGEKFYQMITEDLAADGAYIRREQSFKFKGRDIEMPTVGYDVDTAAAERTFSAIRALSALTMKDVIDPLFQRVALREATNRGWLDKDGNPIFEYDPHKLAYRAMPIMQQYTMVALKADAMVEEAIKARRELDENGKPHKPVITLQFTQQAFFDNLGISPGDDISSLSFADLFKRYLNRSMNFTIYKPPDPNNPDAPPQVEVLNLEDLGVFGDPNLADGGLQQMYGEAETALRAIRNLGLPVSPIDHIKMKLADAGIVSEEITGRSLVADLRNNKMETRDNSMVTHQLTMDRFNNDESLHALIINRAASAGYSLHAAAGFEDQSARWMIVAQPEGDVFTHVQILGRIFRTGQVVAPKYSILSSNVPQEARYIAALQKKVGKMSAATTGAKGSAMGQGSVDFLNAYGLRALLETLMRSLSAPAQAYMGLNLQQMLSGGGNIDTVLGRITNRLSMLPVFAPTTVVNAVGDSLTLPSQREIYEDTIERYLDRIEDLEAAGISIGEVGFYDLQAENKQRLPLSESEGTDSLFQGGVDARYVNMNPIAQPYRAPETFLKIWESLDIQDTPPTAPTSEDWKTLEGHTAAYNTKIMGDIQRRMDLVNKEYVEEIEEINEKLPDMEKAVTEAEKKESDLIDTIDKAEVQIEERKEQKKKAKEDSKVAVDDAAKVAALQRLGELTEAIENQEELIKLQKDNRRAAHKEAREAAEEVEKSTRRVERLEDLMQERENNIAVPLRLVRQLGVGAALDVTDKSGSSTNIAKGIIIAIEDKDFGSDRNPFQATGGLGHSLRLTIALSRGTNVYFRSQAENFAESESAASRWGEPYYVSRLLKADSTPYTLEEVATVLPKDTKKKEDRWILAGNIPKAFAIYQQYFGKVDPNAEDHRKPMFIRYTDNEGEVQRGILLPPQDDIFDLPTELVQPENLERFMNEGGGSATVGDATSNVLIHARNPRDPYDNDKIQAPKWRGYDHLFLSLYTSKGKDNRGDWRNNVRLQELVKQSEHATGEEDKLFGNISRMSDSSRGGAGVYYMRFPKAQLQEMITLLKEEFSMKFFAHHGGVARLREIAERLAREEGTPVISPDEQTESMSVPMEHEEEVLPYDDAALSDQVVSELRAMIQKMIPGVDLAVVDRYIPVGLTRSVRGSWKGLENLITVALNYENPDITLRHEVIHALKEMGMFTEKEWTALTEAAEKTWIKKYKIDERYKQLGHQAQVEEAIAEAFAHFRDGKKFPPGPKRLFSKVRDFLQRVGNMLRGLGHQTVEDVFGRVERGVTGRRKATRTAQRKPGDLVTEMMSNQEVSFKVTVEDTGETVTVTESAKKALGDIDDRIAALEKLKKCLG